MTRTKLIARVILGIFALLFALWLGFVFALLCQISPLATLGFAMAGWAGCLLAWAFIKGIIE